MMDTVGAKRRWVVDILTKLYIIVNQNVDPIIISAVFRGVQGGGRHMVNLWPCKRDSVLGKDPTPRRPGEVVVVVPPGSAIGSQTMVGHLPF